MSRSIDVSPDHLKIIQSILSKHLPSNAQVWVFGSRAKNNAKDFSDLDIAIEIPNSLLSLPTLALLSSDFEESDLPYKVDIVDWKSIADSFRKLIEHDRIKLIFNKK